MNIKFLSALAVVAVLAGCAAMPGASEGSTPPRIVVKDGQAVWDNPSYFGPVPAAQMAKGAATCSALNTKDLQFVAKGYHSKALDVNGNQLPSGGFFCVLK